jgi:hypothetical protein
MRGPLAARKVFKLMPDSAKDDFVPILWSGVRCVYRGKKCRCWVAEKAQNERIMSASPESDRTAALPRIDAMCHVWTAPSWQGFSARSQAGRCSHVFGLFARHTRPLAIMPSADQVPVKTAHSRCIGTSGLS